MPVDEVFFRGMNQSHDLFNKSINFIVIKTPRARKFVEMVAQRFWMSPNEKRLPVT
jgi:hypothetical protein